MNRYISFKELFNLIALDLPIYYDLNIFRSYHNGKITCENFDLEMQSLADRLTTDSKMCAACGDYLAEVKIILDDSQHFHPPESEEAMPLEDLDVNHCHPMNSRICGICSEKIFGKSW